MILTGIGIFCLIMAPAVWVFCASSAVADGRVKEMAHRFATRDRFDLLILKARIIRGDFNLDLFESRERIKAINMALNWKQSRNS